MTDFLLNDTYNGFKVTRVVPLPELQCCLRELVHLKTQAKVLHIENDDPENVFCLSFQTLPNSSNGVAHILEHTVLCGSKKFPIKDPFFAMNRRSLNTFMNALTGSDFTCYPAATQIPQDFYNLLEVYLDAVFHPILDERSFMQEGHRIEFEDPNDKESPLLYKGIVFNEMKGALNSGNARMHEAILREMFPDITYGINSGGDPKNIPDLTYQELLDFHETFYQPSRCLFFFYGDMPLASHLDFIEEHTLSKANSLAPLPTIPAQPRFTTPIRKELSYPRAEEDDSFQDKSLISFGWLTCPVLDQETCLALGVLEVILLDTDASPLKKALLQSNSCKQVSSYLDTDISEVPLLIQLRGCNPENADKLEKIIFDTLQKVIQEGIPQEAIENAIHQYEFHRSEITGDHYPYGLTLFMRSCLLVQHGGTPEHGLIIHSLFDSMRKKTESDPHYFTNLIKKWIVENPHFVRMILKPDSELEGLEQTTEKLKLESIKDSLTEEQTQELVAQAETLKAFQELQEDEDLSVLPQVTLADIPKNVKEFPLSHEKIGNLTVYHHDCFTNEIGYADIFFELPSLTEEELIYTRILSIILTQIGCGTKDYEETLHYIQAHTGGIAAYLTLHMQASDHNMFYPAFALRGKALYRELPKLFPLLHDFIQYPNLTDSRRLHEILQKHFTALDSTMNQNALRYAINLSASCLNSPSYIANLWYGLDYYKVIKNLAENFEKEADNFITMLSSLVTKIFRQGPPDLVLSCSQKEYAHLKNEHFFGFTSLQTHKKDPWNCNIPVTPIESQGRFIASPVAFIGKVFTTISYTHPDAPYLNLCSFLFDNLTLHKKIREEGGAYGGGSVSNVLSGNYYFYSYRDPNIASSLSAFEEAIAQLADGQFDVQDLEEAKLEMIQDFDQPVSPGARADVAYHWLKEGKTKEMRQAFRQRLLAATKENIIAAVKKHIIPQYPTGKTIVFAGKELLESENAKLEAEGKIPLEIFPLR